MNVSKQLREKRLRAGLKIVTLAERAGFSAAHMSNVERFGDDLRLSTIARIAAAYGCEPWELLAELTGGLDVARGREPRFRGEVMMEQWDGGEIVLSDRSGFVLHRFIPKADKPGQWTHVEERQNAPAGVRDVVAVRPAGDAPKDASAGRGPGEVADDDV